jgi:hypothetical protein
MARDDPDDEEMLWMYLWGIVTVLFAMGVGAVIAGLWW